MWIGCMKKVTPSRPRSRMKSESWEELRILSWPVGAGSREQERLFSQPMHRELRLRRYMNQGTVSTDLKKALQKLSFVKVSILFLSIVRLCNKFFLILLAQG